MKINVFAIGLIAAFVVFGAGFVATKKLVRKDFAPASLPSGQTSPSLSAVLQAHTGSKGLRSSYTLKGVRTPTGGPSKLEQKVALSTDGTLTRYDRSENPGFQQTFVLDGGTITEHIFGTGGEAKAKILAEAEADTVKFQLATFGLLPVLKRLFAPNAEVSLMETTSEGDQFQVKTAAGSWFVFTNSEHLIERIKVGDVSIDYQDYRTVAGMQLPFSQRVMQGPELKYRLNIDSIIVDPTFPFDFFLNAKQ